ncbi:hypothetical protein [Kitasatospora sp. MBT66]|uniref:hypothetical protein n=1 Tax=Kitasatospora sp. MBT66 TaxID=1444769 RepID=UPI0005B8A6FC|nr:hypothetical protein [Kitasatospora sp. MBT66]
MPTLLEDVKLLRGPETGQDDLADRLGRRVDLALEAAAFLAVEEVDGDGGAGADRLQGPAVVGVGAADGGDPAANRRPPQRSERPHTATLY